EYFPTFLQGVQNLLFDLISPARFDELLEFAHYIPIDFKEQLQRIDDVDLCRIAPFRSNWMRRFCGQRAQLELVAYLQKLIRAVVGLGTHPNVTFSIHVCRAPSAPSSLCINSSSLAVHEPKNLFSIPLTKPARTGASERASLFTWARVT